MQEMNLREGPDTLPGKMEDEGVFQFTPSCFLSDAYSSPPEKLNNRCSNAYTLNLDLGRINNRMHLSAVLIATNLTFHGGEMFFSFFIKDMTFRPHEILT